MIRNTTGLMMGFFVVMLLVVAGCGGGYNGDSTTAAIDKAVAAVSIIDGNNQTVTVGTELPNPLVAMIKNSGGQPIAGQTVNFKVVSGGGSVFAGAATSDANGIVRERWTLGTASGSQRVEVRAVDSNGAGVVFAAFDAIGEAGTPQTVNYVSGHTQSGTQLLPLPSPVKVKVKDLFGNPVAGISVTFTANDGGSALPASAITNTAGEAEATWTLGERTGLQTLDATASGLPSTIFHAFSESALPRIAIISGDLQTTTQYSTISQPLQVLITDKYGSPSRNADVLFATTTAGGYRSVFTAISGQDGKATATPGYYRNNYGDYSHGLYFSGLGQQKIDVSATGFGTTSLTINVVPTAQIFDGIYNCATSEGYKYTISVSNSVINVVNGRYGGSGTLNVADGTLSATVYMIQPLRLFTSGSLVVNSLQEATGSGTYKYDAIYSLKEGTWSCVRQL